MCRFIEDIAPYLVRQHDWIVPEGKDVPERPGDEFRRFDECAVSDFLRMLGVSVRAQGVARMNAAEVFVRGVWKSIPSEEDTAWVERVAAQRADSSPCGDDGTLVRKMLDAGLSTDEIARFEKIVGYEVAFGICYHLGDPNASYAGFDDEAPEFEWDLYKFKDDEPKAAISCVHELLLSADPSGSNYHDHPDLECQRCGRWSN